MSIFREKWVNNGSLEAETELGQFVCETSSDDVVNYIVQMHNNYLDTTQKVIEIIGHLESIAISERAKKAYAECVKCLGGNPEQTS